MDWTQVIIALISALVGGGFANIIIARSKAESEGVDAGIRKDVSNMQACMRLIDELQEQMQRMEKKYSDLEVRYNDLYNNHLRLITQRNDEERKNIQEIATISTHLSHVKDEIEHYKAENNKLNDIIEMLKRNSDNQQKVIEKQQIQADKQQITINKQQAVIDSLTKEVNRLKKKLMKHEEVVKMD